MSPGASAKQEARDQASRLRALIEQANGRASPQPQEREAAPAPPTERASAEARPQPREIGGDARRRRVPLAALQSPPADASRPLTPVALKPPPSVRAPIREGWGDPASAARRNGGVSRHARPTKTGCAQPVIIAIASGKGGVGKTSLCVNLGVTLARRGVRCAVIDGDIGLANADVLCGVRAGRNLGHALAGECSLRNALTPAPGGFLLVAGASAFGVPDGPAAAGRIISDARLLGDACDAALIDCGAGAGETVLRFLAHADHRIIVCTPEPTSIADAYALLKRLLALDQSEPRRREGLSGSGGRAIAIVVNQARNAADARKAFARIESVSQRFLLTTPALLGWLPSDPRLAQCVRRRVPVALRSRRAPASRAIARLACRLIEQGAVAPRQRRSWSRRAVARLVGLGGLRRATFADPTPGA